MHELALEGKNDVSQLPQGLLKESVVAMLSKLGIQLQLTDADLETNNYLSQTIFEITSKKSISIDDGGKYFHF